MLGWTLRGQSWLVVLALAVPCCADDDEDRSTDELRQVVDVASDIEGFYSRSMETYQTIARSQPHNTSQHGRGEESGAGRTTPTGSRWPEGPRPNIGLPRDPPVSSSGLSLAIRVVAMIVVGGGALTKVIIHLDKSDGQGSRARGGKALCGPNRGPSLTRSTQIPLGPNGKCGLLVRSSGG